MTEEFVLKELKRIGPRFLKKNYQSSWSKENPAWGYCYLISEILYHYYLPNSQSYVIKLGSLGTHWYLVNGTKIVDYTKSQFNFPVPYQRGRRARFFKGTKGTERGNISKRAYELHKVLSVGSREIAASPFQGEEDGVNPIPTLHDKIQTAGTE